MLDFSSNNTEKYLVRCFAVFLYKSFLVYDGYLSETLVLF